VSKDEKTAGKSDEAAGTARGGNRAPDVASAEAYAKDGIYGAPGSEVPGADTPVTRDGSGDTDNRPASQVEGERLGAEADAALQEADRSRETPPDSAESQEHAAKAKDKAPDDAKDTTRTSEVRVKDSGTGAVRSGTVAEVPAQSAAHQEWIDYAVSRGVSRDDANNMTKTELISQYGKNS
jgi:hypothetical protein